VNSFSLQVESFIPLWEWDLPKKKGKKKKAGKESEKGKGKTKANGGLYIEEVEDSGSSRPASRGVTVEDVPDDE
jgi:translocation protein SEC62